MPTNVTPEYKRAEEAFRRAREPRERLECLKVMLRTIPKHKGTEHVQADIKTRMKQLTEELTGPTKRGSRGPSHAVRPAGAAQVALLGPPNAGKSSLHARLTGSHPEIGPHPFTTQHPVPGMLSYEDIAFQLIDLPPISEAHVEPWIVNALQPAEAALLVVDLSDAACVEHVPMMRERLADKGISLVESWPGFASPAADEPAEEEPLENPFRIELPTLLVANKHDLDPGPDELMVLEELLGVRYPAVATSAETGEGLDEIGRLLFAGLRVVRVYTKPPHCSAETDRPFTFHQGQTILDVARHVHGDLAARFRFARVWGSGAFDGQQVGPDHVVEDGDVVELHVRG